LAVAERLSTDLDSTSGSPSSPSCYHKKKGKGEEEEIPQATNECILLVTTQVAAMKIYPLEFTLTAVFGSY